MVNMGEDSGSSPTTEVIFSSVKSAPVSFVKRLNPLKKYWCGLGRQKIAAAKTKANSTPKGDSGTGHQADGCRSAELTRSGPPARPAGRAGGSSGGRPAQRNRPWRVARPPAPAAGSARVAP